MNKKLYAIRNLLPADAAWKLSGDEIIIYTEGLKKPTDAEIDAEIARLEAQDKEAIDAKEAKKASAEAKLAALGLDADDLKALGLV